jgi:DNA-binding PadR family transcriptional regulator
MNEQALSTYENELIESWESTYKQGQLTLWIFLALYESPKPLAELRNYLSEASDYTISADDKSLYRSLRRYTAARMTDFTNIPSENGGPPSKCYELTEIGRRVLREFVQRNLPVQIENKQIKEILSQ